MPYLKLEDTTLFYTSQGTGPAILLLHGYACDSHDWSFQIPYLLSRSYRVIALDQRGHGRSSTPDSPALYTPSHFAADIAALLRHLQTGPVIVVGHSMGSVITSVFAVEYPELVRALVPVHTIYSGTPDAFEVMARKTEEEPDRSPEVVERFFAQVMYTPRTPEWLKTWQLRRVLSVEPPALVGCIVGLVGVIGTVMGRSETTKAFMRRRPSPRLAVCTTEAQAEWEREIGIGEGDEVHVLTEGTFSHVVQSEKFNEILGNWLGKLKIEN